MVTSPRNAFASSGPYLLSTRKRPSPQQTKRYKNTMYVSDMFALRCSIASPLLCSVSWGLTPPGCISQAPQSANVQLGLPPVRETGEWKEGKSHYISPSLFQGCSGRSCTPSSSSFPLDRPTITSICCMKLASSL